MNRLKGFWWYIKFNSLKRSIYFVLEAKFSAAKKNAKKKAAKARKNAEAKKAENEIIEDISGMFIWL